jgi:hypothetical protein
MGVSYLNQYLSVVVHACHLSYAGGVNSRIMVQDGLDKNERPY